VPGVILGGSGNLLGATNRGGASSNCPDGCGVVFTLTNVSGTWSETVLHDFDGGDGSEPLATLTTGGDGSLYGTTLSGGGGLNDCLGTAGNGCGSAFKLTPSGGQWKQTILHDFTGGRDGLEPVGVILDSAGNLFGTTAFGGSRSRGLAYELSPSSK
jgi:hypothetical protein